MNDTVLNSGDAAEQSIFQSSLSVEAKIERARTELLDLSARNRLLNVPRFSKSAKTIDIVDEQSSEIFRILVTEGKAMTFLAGAKGRESKDGKGAEELIELALPDDDERDDSGRLVRHGDTKLQTRMTPNALQKRLLDLYFDARTLEEEQGVNILYLGLGTLKWIDPNNAENIRYAPLILVPVALERGSAAERFKLRARSEDFASNLSLEAFLDRIHKIRMPDFEASDDFSFERYTEHVAAAVSIKPNWSVQPNDIVLGFFSFAKFLMYRDLDPDLWPRDAKFTDRPLITSLVSNGFSRTDDLLPDDATIDEHISPNEMIHIVDADSSQTIAIHEARRGRDLVIQGPPGTGKSQTIANIIASAVADGKTVLFVAEKMAALEVVKRRLDQTGVGDACLELHSNKANKRAILAELQHVWELGAPTCRGAGQLERPSGPVSPSVPSIPTIPVSGHGPPVAPEALGNASVGDRACGFHLVDSRVPGTHCRHPFGTCPADRGHRSAFAACLAWCGRDRYHPARSGAVDEETVGCVVGPFEADCFHEGRDRCAPS